MNDPYEILGVSSGAGADELKKAFRRRARLCHPDSDPDNPWAEDEFKELNAAYDLLSDPERRKRYDQGDLGRNWAQRQPSAKKPTPEKKPEAKSKRSKTAGLKIKGADVEYILHVDFLEAANGAVRHINLTTGKRVKVTIPAGTEEGEILRLKGQGMLGIGGGGDGNAFVEIFIDPHPEFRREGNDIHVNVPITLNEAVLGGKIEAPTINGAVNVTVTKGSNTGTQLRLKGKGVNKGDQFVHLQVVLPKKPDKDLVQFLEQWSPMHAYKVRRKNPKKNST
ncbi:MAG: J domain-containing protein [Rhodospirillales bacterium]|nr:J domain-containing protein [Rhodospirillales bacterium]